MAEPELGRDIVEGCRRGDSAAQRHVFEQYRDRVYSIAMHFLRGDDAAAHDVAQEVFVKVFRAVSSYQGTARFSTWLYRIAANACMDELRRRRRIVFFGDVPEAVHPATVPHEDGALDADITEAVGRLSPKLRMAVLLRYHEDLSYEEIGRALGCTTGTVASRLNRAHAALARDLAHLRPRREAADASDA